MSQFFSGIKLVFKRKDSLIIFILTLVFVSLLFFVWQNGKATLDVLGFTYLSFFEQTKLFFSTLFDLTLFNTRIIQVLVISVSIVSAFNMSLIYLYFKEREELLLKSKALSGFGLLLAVIGAHCVSCGVVFFQIALSTVGLGFIMQYLPLGGLEIGFIGLLILIINTYNLAKKVANPFLC